VLINKGLPWSGSGPPGSSILLVGRSGTGKTSIAVARMWAWYKHTHSVTWLGGTYNQIFVTANSVLRGQVRRSFQGRRTNVFTHARARAYTHTHSLTHACTHARAHTHTYVPCTWGAFPSGCSWVAMDDGRTFLLQA